MSTQDDITKLLDIQELIVENFRRIFEEEEEHEKASKAL
jgi:hypothetical protein